MTSVLDLVPLSGDWRSTTEPVTSGTTNVDPVQVVSALVDFIPRTPAGFTFYLPAYQVEGNDAIIMLGWVGAATAGTWSFGYGGQTATGLAYNISAASLQAAIRGLSSVGAGNVIVTTVTGTADTTAGWYVQFTAAKGNTPIAASDITINNSGLTGGTISPFVSVAGHAIAFRDTALVMDPVFNARVWNGQLSTINVVDTPGFTVPACTQPLRDSLVAQGLPSPFIYDVRFRNVTYARSDNALQNFAFPAPTTTDPVCITSATLQRLPYKPRPDIPAA